MIDSKYAVLFFNGNHTSCCHADRSKLFQSVIKVLRFFTIEDSICSTSRYLISVIFLVRVTRIPLEIYRAEYLNSVSFMVFLFSSTMEKLKCNSFVLSFRILLFIFACYVINGQCLLFPGL